MELKEFERKKVVKDLKKAMWNAWNDYNLIENGDKVMVCLSGGKDSYTMLDLLLFGKKAGQIDFDIIAVNLDQKQPGFPEDVLPKYLNDLGVEYHIEEQDTYSIVQEKLQPGKTMCSLCSRLRRGALYAVAKRFGCNVIALGHHREDIVETLFLNMFFRGKMEAMPAKLKTRDGSHTVIRPLAYCKEKDIQEFANLREYPIIPCNICGSQENLQRKHVKKMLSEWEKEYPGRTENILNATRFITPSHMLDKSLYDFKGIEIEDIMKEVGHIG